MLTRDQFLAALVAARTDQVIVTTMALVRPWGRISNSDLDFASADSAMGHAADFALGIAMARPERTVVCVNGDGSMLMTLGTLVTIVESEVANLVLFVMDNRTYEITGNQSVPGAGTVDYPALAKAAGFKRTYRCDDPASCNAVVRETLQGPGPTFLSAVVEPGNEGPISRSASEESAYLQVSLAESARALRSALGER